MQMHRWEYLAIELDSAYGQKRPRYRNHEEISDWESAPPYVDYFNELGNEGWELVALATGESIYLFKRPR